MPDKLVFHYDNPPLMARIARGYRFQNSGYQPWAVVTRPPFSEEEAREFSKKIVQIACEQFRLEARHALN